MRVGTRWGAPRALSRCGLAVGLALVLSVAACSGRPGAATGGAGVGVSVPADTDRFPHGVHTGDDPRIRGFQGRGLGCADCHAADAVERGEVARPGTAQHAPCDQCHKAEFYRPPGAFCRVCHESVDPRVAGKSPLQPYPERGFSRVLASEFSHQGHLDPGAMERAVGFHLACGDCHVRDADSRDPRQPGHAQCARCHGAGAKATGARGVLPMSACARCHPARDVELRRGRQLITGDLIFAHAAHERDQAGQPIACQTCHAEVATSEQSADISVPAMARCATCHEDAGKTPDRVRIARCGVCHTAITSGSPPASHGMGGGDLPEDHTLEFRRNHGDQAADPRSNCRFCHTEVSRTGRDACFQCHEVMRPRDHGIAWREDAHGREAEVDGDRCASCHQADYCTACHSIPPRSHQPYEEFRLGGHGEAARFDPTSCQACHTNRDTCADCHRSRR